MALPLLVVLLLLLLLPLAASSSSSVPGSTIVLSPDSRACRVMGFFPTSVGKHRRPVVPSSSGEEEELPYRWTDAEMKRVSASMMVAAKMALDHFRARNPAIVKEIRDVIPMDCDVDLTLEVATEDVDAVQAGKVMLDSGKRLCALLGTYTSDAARAMQPSAASLDLPQVIYYTTDAFLTSSQRETAVSFPPTVLPRARALAEYLNGAQDILEKREYLAMIYEDDYTSSYLAQCFQEDAAGKYGLESARYQDDHFGIIPGNQTGEGLQRKAIEKVRDSGVRTIFLNKVQSHSLKLTSQLLDEAGMLTDEYLYVFTSEAVPTDAASRVFGEVLANSPLDRLLRGGIVLDHIDPFRHDGAEDPFLREWRSLGGPDFLRNVSTEFPGAFDVVDSMIGDDPAAYFRETMPADYSSFLYDAVMSIGIGACRATTAAVERAMEESNGITTTTTLKEDIRTWNFTGASGRVEWGCYGSNRCNEPLKFGIFNVRAVPVEADDGGNGPARNTYETVLTAVWDDVNRWQKVDDFVYRDGTTAAPTIVREALENNFITPGVRGFGLFLYGSALALGLAGLAALVVLRGDAVIVRSQPFFLALVCVGSVVMCNAILTLLFDESSFASERRKDNRAGIRRGLDVACMSTMWFFFVGQVLVFAALCTKLWRLDQVLQTFRRRSLTRNQALVPLIAILALTVTILVVWTVADPWSWDRVWISLVPAETVGRCQSEHFWAFFGPLMAIVVLAEGLTLFYAYKTSDVNADLSDRETSLQAMFTQFQAWVIGIPFLAVLGNDASTNAVFISRALLIWIFSVSSVVFVIGSKVYRAIVIRRNPEMQGNSRKGLVVVSGLGESVATRHGRCTTNNDILRRGPVAKLSGTSSNGNSNRGSIISRSSGSWNHRRRDSTTRCDSVLSHASQNKNGVEQHSSTASSPAAGGGDSTEGTTRYEDVPVATMVVNEEASIGNCRRSGEVDI